VRATQAILLAITVSGLCAGGCAPIYHTYDPNAPDNPAHLERARAEAKAADYRERLGKARAAYETGQTQRALDILKDLLAGDPTYAPAHQALGQIHMARGDWVNAESSFGRAGKLDPDDYEAHFGQGTALTMLGKFREAAAAYHRALVARPASPEASLSLATTYLRLNENRNALAFAEKAVELDPENGVARANLGAVYERLGRYADAVGQYDVALEYLEPTGPLLTNLVNSQLGAGRLDDESVDAYRRALELNPNHWRALNGIGTNAMYRWQLSQRRDAAAARDARDAFRKSLRVNPNQPEIIRLMLSDEL
jgi:tetratricopeptide (TPR) repeat protein